ncbi:MAG TPA: sigma 54-interacting transcriptional regulator, partial [Thermoanaerobaculia bacterium]|nr:sigma 54-interacting transcriptional regulator [Thermoanaerobaculia bacterium]
PRRPDREGALDTETRDSSTLDDAVLDEQRVPALTLLCHPDPDRVGEQSPLTVLAHGPASEEAVALSRLAPLFAAPGSSDLRPLGDPHLSRRPLTLSAAPEGAVLLRRAGSTTRCEIDGETLGDERLLAPGEIERGVTLLLARRVVALLHLHPPLTPQVPSYGMVGDSAPMLRLRQEVRLVASLETPVLLLGDTGTGKELLAAAIHRVSARRERPYVAVNMAAVPASLAAAELFGASRGAYTGADRKRQGFFARADGGTLFLDEIGEAPTDVQPLLLRALESGDIQPVGGGEARRVDVRVIAATDADLATRSTDGRFRAPLLHRLAGYEIRLPALTERCGDLGRLLYHFLGEELERFGEDGFHDADGRPWPPAVLVARLALYDWPGNVRQLKNVARRLAIARRAGGAVALDPFIESLLSGDTGSMRRPAAAPDEPPPPAAAAPPSAAPSPTGRWRPVYRKPSELTDDEVVAAMTKHRWEVKAAAEELGVSRSALYTWIESSDRLRKASDLEAAEIERALATTDGDPEAAAGALEVSAQGLKRRIRELGLR